MTTNQTLVQMLQMSSWQLEQTVSGFDADQWFHAPAEGVASAAWVVGHATLIDRHVLEELDLPALPAIPKDWRALYQTCPEDDYGTVLEMIGNMSLYTSQLAGEAGLARQSLGMPVDEDWLP